MGKGIPYAYVYWNGGGDTVRVCILEWGGDTVRVCILEWAEGIPYAYVYWNGGRRYRRRMYRYLNGCQYDMYDMYSVLYAVYCMI
jgi:hypothetical protein